MTVRMFAVMKDIIFILLIAGIVALILLVVALKFNPQVLAIQSRFEEKQTVLVGTQGWLFPRSDLQCDKMLQDVIQKNVADVIEAQRELRARNIDLYVMVVPARTPLYRQYLPRTAQLPSCFTGVHEDILNRLGAGQVNVIPLKPYFDQALQQQELYLKTDIFWSSAGARIAALSAAEAVLSQGYMFPKKTFTSSLGENKAYTGALWRDLSAHDQEKIPPDQLQTYVTAPQENAKQDEPLVPAPVLIVGTGFSADILWNFSGFLQEFLQSDVTIFAGAQGDALHSMDMYLTDSRAKSTPPALIIWEIPEENLVQKH